MSVFEKDPDWHHEIDEAVKHFEAALRYRGSTRYDYMNRAKTCLHEQKRDWDVQFARERLLVNEQRDMITKLRASLNEEEGLRDCANELITNLREELDKAHEQVSKLKSLCESLGEDLETAQSQLEDCDKKK